MSKMKSYADTNVSPGRTKEQIESLLLKVDATGFCWSTQLPTSAPGYERLEAALDWNDKQIAFRLEVAYDDERQKRQRLRALYWYLKAKIEAIQFGLVDLEREFLPYLITASGKTVYEELGGVDMKLLPAPLAEVAASPQRPGERAQRTEGGSGHE